MVHNGIEYGIMAAYAEGLNILKHANVGKHQQEIDAETSPLRNPEYYQYDLNLPEVAELWRRGSVVGSWLLDLTAHALLQSPDLANFQGRVSIPERDDGRSPPPSMSEFPFPYSARHSLNASVLVERLITPTG